MRKINLILILTATLWNTLPAGSPFRALFDLITEDPTSGDVWSQEDPPDGDTKIINLPPPR